MRLLLEDVSREHCRIEFSDEAKVRTVLTQAVLHILGTNGVLHNGVHVKPGAAQNWIDLADGDKLQISKHVLSFSYQPREKQPETPKEVQTPKSTPRRRRQAASDSPMTPRRQSARLKAKYNSPRPDAESAQHVEPVPEQPEVEKAETQQKEIPTFPDASIAPPVDGSSIENAKDAQDAEPSEASQPIADVSLLHETPVESNVESNDTGLGETPTDEQVTLGQSSGERSPREAPSETAEFPSSEPMPPTTVEVASKEEAPPALPSPAVPISEEHAEPTPTPSEAPVSEENAPSSDADESVRMLHLDALEAASVDQALLSPNPPPKSPSTPERPHIRVPQSLPRHMPRTPPLQWTPSKSRKISLRTATLLKRSAQYPLVPMSESRAPHRTAMRPPASPIAPRTSTGSRDMDMTRDFAQASSSDSDLSSDDEDEVDQSLGSPGSGAGIERAKTPEPQERAPVLSTFLTPQQPKQRTLRRLSNPEAPETPRLKTRSSWQWLRSLFASPAQQEKQKGAEHEAKNEPPSIEAVDPDEAQPAPVQGAAEDLEPAQDEFFDVEPEEAAVETYEPMDLDPVEPGPEVSLTNTSWMFGSPAPEPRAADQVVSTPDMHVLKHMFAEPPASARVSAFSDFRHIVRTEEPADEVSLAHAWNTMAPEEEPEEPWHDGLEEQVEVDQPPAPMPNPVPAAEQVEAAPVPETTAPLDQHHPPASPSTPSVEHASPTKDEHVLVHEPAANSMGHEESGKPQPPLDSHANVSMNMPTSRPAPEAPAAVPDPAPSTPTAATAATHKEPSPQEPSRRLPETQPAVKHSQRAKVTEPTAPVRMSPRRAAQTRAQAPASAPAQDTRATRMTTRTLTQKEPYVPVRRRLPARAAVSNLGSMSTTATRASRVPNPTRTEDTTRTAGADARAKRTSGSTSSIPLASSISRRTTSTIQMPDDTSQPKQALAGTRTTRATRSARRNE